MEFKNRIKTVCMLSIICCIGGCGIGWPVYRAKIEKISGNGVPLISAIKKYEEDKGTPPDSLDKLVPDYIREIPLTGYHSDYGVGDKFAYKVFPDQFRKITRIWYDLGSRGHSRMEGLWVYREGNPDHAILVFTLDKYNRVIEARVDRMPKEYQPAEFNIDKWKTRESRIEMVRSLPKYIAVDNMTSEELIGRLGSPDGTVAIRDASWELRVNTRLFDEFIYWPSMNYPQDSRKYIRVGDWVLIPD